MPGAIVIGAGPGIGTSVAQRFAREGLPVSVLARSRPTVDAALAALDDTPAQTLGLTVDVTDETALRARTRRGGRPVRRARCPRLQRCVDPVGRPRRAHGSPAARRVGGQRRGRDHRDHPSGPGHDRGRRGHDPHHRRDAGARPGGDEPVAGQGRRPRARRAAWRVRTSRPACTSPPSQSAGTVAPGSAFDPDEIAEEYWRLHVQPAGSWEREVRYPGRPAPSDAPGVEAAGRGGG